MKKRSVYSLISVFVLIIAVLTAPVADAVILTFETQNSYAAPDSAWLTDVVINEDTATVAGLVQRAHFSPVPAYKYSETPESFKKDISYYITVYSLNDGMQKAGYVYLFDLLNKNSNIIAANVSDAAVRDYLEGIGIVYPSDVGTDELVMARALYTAMITGAYAGVSPDGKSLDEMIIGYVSAFSGIDAASLKKWMPQNSVLSLDEYILAASKLALWTNGYDVTADTDSNEVFRLIAVMSLEKMGISTDKNASSEELKAAYTAALLGVRYGVSLNRDKLSSALKKGDEAVAFYVLQMLGQQAGLSIRSDNCSYDDAFYIVAENTDAFVLEDDEFYADIYEYNVYLTAKRSSVWLMPKSYSGSNKSSIVEITADGDTLRDNYYNEIKLNSSLEVQTVKIKVSCTANGKTSVRTYTFNFYQSDNEPPKGDIPTADDLSGFITSDSIIGGIFSSMGINRSLGTAVDNLLVSVPSAVKGIISFISPTFGEDGDASASASSADDSSHAEKEIVCASILDKIGSVADVDIKGVDGLKLVGNTVSGKGLDLVSFGK